MVGKYGEVYVMDWGRVVLVLLPAGSVPIAEGENATPLNEVLLDAFFLSKYEMTISPMDPYFVLDQTLSLSESAVASCERGELG